MSSHSCIRCLPVNIRTTSDIAPEESIEATGLVQSFINPNQSIDFQTSEQFKKLFFHRLISLITKNQLQNQRNQEIRDSKSSTIRKRQHPNNSLNNQDSTECSAAKQRRLTDCWKERKHSEFSPDKRSLVSKQAKFLTRPEALAHSTSPTLSANVNENNDNGSIFPSPRDNTADENTNDFLNQDLRLLGAHDSNSSLLYGREICSSKFNKELRHAGRARRASYNTNPLASHAHNQSRTHQGDCTESGALAKFALDNKAICRPNKRRRFCETKPIQDWPELAAAKDPGPLKGVKFPFRDHQEELHSPPRRIHRQLRRTQSTSNQVRVSTTNRKHQYQSGTTSWEAEHFSLNRNLAELRAPISSTEDNPPRVSSAPAYIPGDNTTSRKQYVPFNRFELNCNANATTGGRLYPHHTNSVKSENSFQLPLKEDEHCSDIGFNFDFRRSIFEKGTNTENETGFNENKRGRKFTFSRNSANAPTDKITHSSLSNSKILPRITPSKLTHLEVNKQKSDSSEPIPCACLKRQYKSHSKLFEVGLESEVADRNTLDQDIAASVRCLCRISSNEDKCRVCGPTKTVYSPSCKDHALEVSTDKAKISSHNLKKSLQKDHFAENRIKYLAQRPSQVVERNTPNPRRFHQTKGVSTLPVDRRSRYSCSSAERQYIPQTSTNNHNIAEETTFRRNLNKRKETHCCDALCLLIGGSHSPQRSASLVFSKLLYAANAASPKHVNLGVLTPERTDMGCFHSVSNKSKVGPCRTNIFSDVQATIDQSPTVIEEYSPIVLRYRTPYFRANAQVIMPPIRRKETWTVGWIQACDYMKFINQYGNLGCSSWEIPALKSGKIPAVSDSDGVSYPWYGNTTEIATIVGPTDTYRRMNLTMNDNFYPSVTWDIPVSEGTNAHLTRIIRDQSFITWLAAINETTKDIIVLKTVRWNFYLEIDIDPTRELGQRARIVAPPVQKQPRITNGPCEKSQFSSPVRHWRRGATDNNSNSTYVGQIPMSALVRPSANNAQTLIWRPTDNHAVVVVPAKEEHRDSAELVLFNGCSAMHGKESIIKEISKQEMIQIQQLTR